MAIGIEAKPGTLMSTGSTAQPAFMQQCKTYRWRSHMLQLRATLLPYRLDAPFREEAGL